MELQSKTPLSQCQMGFVEAYKKFAEAGWSSISLPSEIGGGGMPVVLSGGTLEILSSANLAFGLAQD